MLGISTPRLSFHQNRVESSELLRFENIQMHLQRPHCLTSALLIASFLLQTIAFSESASPKPRRTMAHTVVSPDYQREQLPNGRWKPETYAIAMGQMLDPTGEDDSLTTLSTEDMAEIIANALYKEDFLPETNPEETDLLIVVNWGKTIPYHDGLQQHSLDRMADAVNGMNQANLELGTDSPGLGSGGNVSAGSNQFEAELETMLTVQSMSDRARHQANAYNAALLGFAPDMADLHSSELVGGPQRLLLDDLEDEIESERYFVILQAYDFPELIQNKAKRILWMTRFSIRAKGRQFDQEFANMTNAASKVFGIKSNRLSRGLLPGDTSLGEIEVVGTVEEGEIEED